MTLKNLLKLEILLTDEEFKTNVPHFNLPRFIASDSVIVIRK